MSRREAQSGAARAPDRQRNGLGTPPRMRGKEAENALHRANITISRSTIPFDTNTPFNPSGIRVGSQAITTRGMKEAEMQKVGAYIAEALRNTQNDAALGEIQKKVLELANQFPLYGWRRI